MTWEDWHKVLKFLDDHGKIFTDFPSEKLLIEARKKVNDDVAKVNWHLQSMFHQGVLTFIIEYRLVYGSSIAEAKRAYDRRKKGT